MGDDQRDETGGDNGIELAEAFADIARALLADKTLEETLQRVSRLAVDVVHGCDHAGISVIEGRRITTTAASDDVAVSVDKIQYETDQGPCLDAIRDDEVLRADDLSQEDRWPEFARQAAETGVRSLLAFRLFADGETMGALNLYSKERAAFDDEAMRVGTILAAHAAVAMVSVRTNEQKDEAIRSRDVIGRAKGILMARQAISDEEAFELLRRASQRMNVKLRDIAAQVAESPVGDVGAQPVAQTPEPET